MAQCNGTGPWLSGCPNACIPADLARYTTMIYNLIKVIVPIALIMIGMFDMAKAITTKSQEEVKKAQQLLVRKAVAGALVFVLFSGIAWVLEILDSTSGGDDGQTTLTCLAALFDYHEGTSTTERTPVETREGNKFGYTDPNTLCKKDGYDGVLQVYGEGQSGYYYVCYDYDKYHSDCNVSYNASDVRNPGEETAQLNGKKYTLADGAAYCVTIIEEKSSGASKAVLHGDDKFSTCNYTNAMDENGAQSQCQKCCNDFLDYSNAYALADSGKCLCTKKR